MALFSRKKKPGADQRELLERLDGRELQTVTRRIPKLGGDRDWKGPAASIPSTAKSSLFVTAGRFSAATPLPPGAES